MKPWGAATGYHEVKILVGSTVGHFVVLNWLPALMRILTIEVNTSLNVSTTLKWMWSRAGL